MCRTQQSIPATATAVKPRAPQVTGATSSAAMMVRIRMITCLIKLKHAHVENVLLTAVSFSVQYFFWCHQYSYTCYPAHTCTSLQSNRAPRIPQKPPQQQQTPRDLASTESDAFFDRKTKTLTVPPGVMG